MLLGGAVLLSAVGIIGTTDFEKLKSDKKKKSEFDTKLKKIEKKLEKRLKKIEDNLEDCCNISEGNKKYLELFCIFVSTFSISPIEIFINNILRSISI